MQNRHNSEDLAQMQSLPLDVKIEMTKRRIKQWYDYHDGMVYLSFSGGKDSTVLKHIVDSMYDDVPAVFSNTGLEYTQIQKFAREHGATFVQPKIRFDEVISTYGYPIISKEVAEAIYYARRIRSQTVQVERERTAQRKRSEICGCRPKENLPTDLWGGDAERCCQDNSKWGGEPEQEPPCAGLSQTTTIFGNHAQEAENARKRSVYQTNRGSEWKDWRRGCL